MTKRRQALRCIEPLATPIVLLLLVFVCFVLMSTFAPLEPIGSGAKMGDAGQPALLALMFIPVSAAMLVFWSCHRRDDASPRRIGRRI